MADYAALQEQNKLSALRAMAAGNPDPYAGSSGVVSGAQDEALNRYASDAAGRAAPQPSISQGEAMIRAPGDAALAGLGESSSAYQGELSAINAQTANAAANPSSVPQYSTGSTSQTKAQSQQDQGYKQYGGYNTSAEYENAVLGRAQQDEAQRHDQVQADTGAQQAAFTNQSTDDRLAAAKALEAKNEAIVGGPGAVIHGIGYTPPPAPAAPPPPVGVGASPNVGPGGMLVPVVRQPPPPLSLGDRPPAQFSNYTPEQTAMLRAASDTAYGKTQANDKWLGGMQAGANQTLNAIADPTNMYEFAQRAAINELGGDPYEAIGRFSPSWGMKNYALPSVQEPNQYQGAQNEALERANNEASGLGAYTDSEISGRRTQTIRNSADYTTGAAVAEAQIQTLGTGAKSDQPVTLDGLRAALAKAGVSPIAAAQVVSDYGRLYPGVSFYTNPDEINQAQNPTPAQAAATNAQG